MTAAIMTITNAIDNMVITGTYNLGDIIEAKCLELGIKKKKDVRFVKNGYQEIERFKTMIKIFCSHNTVEASAWAGKQAERLKRFYGLNCEDIEDLEHMAMNEYYKEKAEAEKALEERRKLYPENFM